MSEIVFFGDTYSNIPLLLVKKTKMTVSVKFQFLRWVPLSNGDSIFIVVFILITENSGPWWYSYNAYKLTILKTQTQTQFIWPAISYNMHKTKNQSLLSGDSTKTI